MKFLSLITFIALLSACGGAPKPYTADLTEQVVQPPTLQVASPIQRTLVVQMKNKNVPDEMTIKNSIHKMVGFRAFMETGIRNAMAPYFTDVVFVGDEKPTHAGPHAVATVKVDFVEATPLQRGDMTYTILKLQWSFAVRLAEYKQFMYSYAGFGNSADTYEKLEIGASQMLDSSLTAMVKGWADQGISEQINTIDAGFKANPGKGKL